jgi:hypothetical protein
LKASTRTAAKVSALVRPLGYLATAETVTAREFELPLLALTNQESRQMSVAIRLNVAIDRQARWREAHAYQVRELIDYAHRINRIAHVVMCGSLTEGTPARVQEASEALRDIIASITANKAASDDTPEQQRWTEECRDLLDY